MKKNFPIRYMRKGLFLEFEEIDRRKDKKKAKRRIRKPKQSVHYKTRKERIKTK